MSAKKRGLGQGLDALLRPQEEGPRTLPLSQLKPIWKTRPVPRVRRPLKTFCLNV